MSEKEKMPAGQEVKIPENVAKSDGKGKGIKKTIIIIAVILAIVAAGGYAGYNYMLPENKLGRALEKSDYKMAVDICNRYGLKENDRLISLIESQLTNIENNYENGIISYDDSLAQIEEIEKLNVENINTEDIKANLLVIENSRKTYDKAVSYYENNNLKESIVLFEEVSEKDKKNYSSAQKYHSDAIDKFRDEELKKAQDAADSGDLTSAVSILKQATSILGNDSVVEMKMEEYRLKDMNNAVEKVLSESKELADKKDYLEAIKVLSDFIANGNDDSRLKPKLDEYTNSYIALVVENADKLKSDGKYDEAKKILSEANEKFPSNSKITQYLEKNQKSIDKINSDKEIEDLLSQAEAAVQEGDYKKAIEILQNSKYKDNEKITQKIQEYEKYLPVMLSDLKMTNSALCSFENQIIDPLGNKYMNVFKVYSESFITSGLEHGWGEFFTDGKYNKLTFTIVPNEDFYKSENKKFYIGVKVDDKLIYTSENITYKTEPIEVTCDISGCKYLRIGVLPESTGQAKCGIVNPIVSAN